MKKLFLSSIGSINKKRITPCVVLISVIMYFLLSKGENIKVYNVIFALGFIHYTFKWTCMDS